MRSVIMVFSALSLFTFGCGSDSGTSAPPESAKGTACEAWENTANLDSKKNGNCSGNVGCTERSIGCGECGCEICWNETCLFHNCNHGGTPECPGGPGGFDDVYQDVESFVDVPDVPSSDDVVPVP